MVAAVAPQGTREVPELEQVGVFAVGHKEREEAAVGIDDQASAGLEEGVEHMDQLHCRG